MTNGNGAQNEEIDHGDLAPGAEPADPHASSGGMAGYFLGYGLAVLLTGASFLAVRSDLIYQPAVVSALVVLAIAQMGVHLVFFLHLTTGPDHINNVLALAFGVLIVGLVVLGSIWIMGHLEAHKMSSTPPGADISSAVACSPTVRPGRTSRAALSISDCCPGWTA